jgi:hypothetical protein
LYQLYQLLLLYTGMYSTVVLIMPVSIIYAVITYRTYRYIIIITIIISIPVVRLQHRNSEGQEGDFAIHILCSIKFLDNYFNYDVMRIAELR